MEKQKHIIDPDKFAKTLRIKWEHPEYDQELEPKTDQEAYVFSWRNGVEIYFSNNSPHQLIINPAFESEENNTYIKFKDITHIHYFENNDLIVVESIDEKSFSQMAIFADSEFHIVINEPLANHSKSFSNIYKNFPGGGKQYFLRDS